ncbi:MAG: NRAMP family divalent metal transporter [Aggregatilineales bacterium]
MLIETTQTPGNVIEPGVTTEDINRAKDRIAIRRLRTGGGLRPLLLLLMLIGPGILVMIGENDGPSMLSYAATGATYGIGFFLPFVLLTFAMAYVVQEMTIRLGAVSQRGHAELIFQRFGPFWGRFAMIDLAIGNFLTLVTEFIAIRAGLGFFGVPPTIAVSGGFLVAVGVMLSRRYWTWERIALGLAFFNLLFVPVAFLVHPDLGQVATAFATWGPLPGGFNQNMILLVMANIGATVTPWMLFFQQSAVMDKGLTPKDIPHGRIDTAIGAILAALIACATIIATSVLFTHQISTANFQGAEFAQALEPYVGRIGATLFALGIIEAGLLAVITISSSSAYAFGEVTGFAHSLNRPLREAWGFYAVMALGAACAAGLVLIPGAPLVLIVLAVNVVATLSMPPALVFLILLVNDREIMGKYANGRVANVLAVSIVLFLCAVSLIWGVMTVISGFSH